MRNIKDIRFMHQSKGMAANSPIVKAADENQAVQEKKVGKTVKSDDSNGTA